MGYGPARSDFAWVMVDACRNVQAGATSYDELAASDIASGASRAEAQRMYGWLKTSFCPHVKAVGDQQQPGQRHPARAPRGLRALGTSVKVWDAKFRPTSQKPCRAASGEPLGTARAYLLSRGVTVCLDYLDRKPLGDVQDSAALVFAAPVPQQTALADIAKLLPNDAREVNALHGSNPGYAPNPGSCLSVLYTSSTWKRQMSQYDSTDGLGVTYDTHLKCGALQRPANGRRGLKCVRRNG